MSEQTLYEILEVSEKATPDKIRAAWTRLSVKWDPLRPHNYDHEARMRYEQIKDAYVTLGSPHKRAAYDRRLQLRRRQQSSQEQQSRASAQPKLAVAALVAAVVMGGSYFMTRDQSPIVTARAKSPADYLPKDALESASKEDDSRQQETIVAVSVRGPAPARVSAPPQEARVALSSVVKPREEPPEERSEPIALKLDKDLALGQKRGSTALSQL